MIFCCIVVFVLGILGGALSSVCMPSRKHRRQPIRRSKVHLDDVDQMVLYGEVTNDPFYKGL